jgi:carbamate kinase
LAFSEGAKASDRLFEMPFPECGAMSQGYIGYHLQNALATDLGPDHPVVSLITQVEVDPMDPMFSDPTKPIGSFYTEEQAKRMAHDKGYVMKQDAGRGYRRVIASPKPVGIVEIEAIKALLKDHFTVISVGGGGIPVVKNNGGFTGVDAVIDKDFASSLLAREVSADILLILTAVSHVSLHYREPNEIRIHRLSVKEAQNYISEGHFAKGSMLPKVEAAIEFVKGYPNRKAIITSLEDRNQR